MTRKILPYLFLLPLLVTFASAQTEELPPMEVNATRLSEAPFEQPYAIYRLTTDELDQTVGRTALDRFNYGPGVFLQRTAPNQGSPFVRGLTGEQALLTLDGVRLSHAFMRPGPNQYAALVPGVSLSSIEAILGPSSVVNGSDGLTGSLDFRLAAPGRGVDGPASPWFGLRADTGHGGGTLYGGVDGIDGNWAYSLEASGSRFDDREGGKDASDRLFGSSGGDTIPNTAYDAWSAGGRVAYLGITDRVLTLKAGHSTQLEAPRPDGYFANTGKSDRRYRYFDPMSFTYLHLRDRVEIGSAALESLQTTLWWHRFAEEQFRSSVRDQGDPGQRLRRREYDNTNDAFGIDVQAVTRLGAGDRHELTWGGSYIHETTDNAYREFRTPAGSLDEAAFAPHNPADWANNTTVSDGSDYNTLGVFAQDLWQIAPDLNLLTGLRFSHMDWSFGDVDGDTSDVSGSVRGQWSATETHRLFAGVSRGFRAPNLTNLDGLSDRGSSGQAAQGNPNLDPETSVTSEVGWKWRRDRDQLALTAFTTTIDDLIQRDFRGSGEVTNVESAQLEGLEALWDIGGAVAGLQRVAFVGSASVVEGTRDIPLEGGGVQEDYLSRASRMYGNTGVKIEADRNWWSLLQIRWHDAYNKVATHPSDSDADDVRLTVAGHPDGSLPGYGVLDLLLGWRNDAGDRSFGIYVENLGDQTYRAPGSGTDGVGRSYGVTCEVRL